MPDFRTSVEDFAALRALLDDPFADAAASLARAGLDEPSYVALTAAWRARLARECETDSDLGRRFAMAYRKASTARRARAGKEDAVRQEDARFLNRDAQPWRAEAAQVALLPNSTSSQLGGAAGSAQAAPVAGAAATRDNPAAIANWGQSGGPNLVVANAWPATPGWVAPRAAPLPAQAPLAEVPPLVPDVEEIAPSSNDEPWETATMMTPSSTSEAWETGTLPVSSSEPGRPALPFFTGLASRTSPAPPARSSLAGLPFQPSSPGEAERSIPPQVAAPEHVDATVPLLSASVPPRKRLMRFDPQTGNPLPFPVWVDVPPDGDEEKKR
ncbi:hypothetical protein [Sorangium sp. So ce1153]|uniref:hypothetical protein n=1 Tax=Sorangium sp. So ce1153 TaxID=3133333 RepID=UPI003F5F2410